MESDILRKTIQSSRLNLIYERVLDSGDMAFKENAASLRDYYLKKDNKSGLKHSKNLVEDFETWEGSIKSLKKEAERLGKLTVAGKPQFVSVKTKKFMMDMAKNISKVGVKINSIFSSARSFEIDETLIMFSLREIIYRCKIALTLLGKEKKKLVDFNKSMQMFLKEES